MGGQRVWVVESVRWRADRAAILPTAASIDGMLRERDADLHPARGEQTGEPARMQALRGQEAGTDPRCEQCGLSRWGLLPLRGAQLLQHRRDARGAVHSRLWVLMVPRTVATAGRSACPETRACFQAVVVRKRLQIKRDGRLATAGR
jgi:hypothetical protein